MSNLYSRIEELCESRHITIGRMCKDIGMHRSVMGNLSSGASKALSAKTLQLISTYFGVPIEYFLDPGEPNTSDIPPEPAITKSQFLFALYGDVPSEITDDDIEEIRKYASMVRLRKESEKKGE